MFNPFVTRANGGLHLIVPGLKPVIALLNAFMLQSLFGIGQLTPRAHQFRKTDFCVFFSEACHIHQYGYDEFAAILFFHEFWHWSYATYEWHRNGLIKLTRWRVMIWKSNSVFIFSRITPAARLWRFMLADGKCKHIFIVTAETIPQIKNRGFRCLPRNGNWWVRSNIVISGPVPIGHWHLFRLLQVGRFN